jgi:PTH1 family peptidyl-tRNA hydrolase
MPSHAVLGMACVWDIPYMPIKLIVGLRNPGSDYENTRHNAGEWFLNAWANHQRLSFHAEKKFQGEMVSATTTAGVYHLLLPLTYMNLSGMPIRLVSQFYRILPNEILVAHDDLDLPAGRIKLKTGGGHGGHNGLRDMISQLGSADFHRLRVGIGHPGDKALVLNYVLSKPSSEDKQVILKAVERAVDVTPMLLAGSVPDAMTQLNQG